MDKSRYNENFILEHNSFEYLAMQNDVIFETLASYMTYSIEWWYVMMDRTISWSEKLHTTKNDIHCFSYDVIFRSIHSLTTFVLERFPSVVIFTSSWWWNQCRINLCGNCGMATGPRAFGGPALWSTTFSKSVRLLECPLWSAQPHQSKQMKA